MLKISHARMPELHVYENMSGGLLDGIDFIEHMLAYI